MLLRGKFSYERENQRTLPFNVDIRELPEAKTIFVGDSSEFIVVLYCTLLKTKQKRIAF
jgi:hypothetical protein